MKTAISTWPTPAGLDGSDGWALAESEADPIAINGGHFAGVPEEAACRLTYGEDKAWAERAWSGDEEAARTLVERLSPTILKLVRCHLPRRTSEEDLVQTVFLKVFHRLNQYSGQAAPLEHWVSRITINTCINQLRHETARPELRMSDLSEEQEAVVTHLACTDAELPGDRGKAARELLETLLVRLKPDQRLVITLLHLEERSVEEVSRITGWSSSRVKVKAFRARHRLRRLWLTLLGGERL